MNNVTQLKASTATKQSGWPVPFSGTISCRDDTHQDEMNTYLSLTLPSTCAKVFPLLFLYYIRHRKEIQANFLAKNNKHYKQDNRTTQTFEKIKVLALHRGQETWALPQGKKQLLKLFLHGVLKSFPLCLYSYHMMRINSTLKQALLLSSFNISRFWD